MKEEFVLDKIITTESSKGPGLRVELIPKKEVYSKNVKLVFSGDNVMQVLENFGIPDRIGDIIEFDLKPKNVQKPLPGTDADKKEKTPGKP